MRVPGGRHSPDDAAHDELAALAAAGRVQDVEVVLAVLPPLKLVEHAVGEGTETLSAAAGVIKMPSAFASPFEFAEFVSAHSHETLRMEHFPVGVDFFRVHF